MIMVFVLINAIKQKIISMNMSLQSKAPMFILMNLSMNMFQSAPEMAIMIMYCKMSAKETAIIKRCMNM